MMRLGTAILAICGAVLPFGGAVAATFDLHNVSGLPAVFLVGSDSVSLPDGARVRVYGLAVTTPDLVEVEPDETDRPQVISILVHEMGEIVTQQDDKSAVKLRLVEASLLGIFAVLIYQICQMAFRIENV